MLLILMLLSCTSELDAEFCRQQCLPGNVYEVNVTLMDGLNCGCRFNADVLKKLNSAEEL